MSHDTSDTTTGNASAPAASANEDALKARLAEPCEVRVLEQGGRFRLYDVQLGLTACGADLAQAHAELRRAREARLREFAAEGVLHWLPAPGAALAEPGLLKRLRPFLIKAAVVLIAVLGVVNVVAGGLGEVGYQLEKKLDRVANWPPEEVEKQRQKAAKVADKLGPVLHEILRAAQGAPAVSAAAPAAIPAAAPAAAPAPATGAQNATAAHSAAP